MDVSSEEYKPTEAEFEVATEVAATSKDILQVVHTVTIGQLKLLTSVLDNGEIAMSMYGYFTGQQIVLRPTEANDALHWTYEEPTTIVTSVDITEPLCLYLEHIEQHAQKEMKHLDIIRRVANRGSVNVRRMEQ